MSNRQRKLRLKDTVGMCQKQKINNNKQIKGQKHSRQVGKEESRLYLSPGAKPEETHAKDNHLLTVCNNTEITDQRPRWDLLILLLLLNKVVSVNLCCEFLCCDIISLTELPE